MFMHSRQWQHCQPPVCLKLGFDTFLVQVRKVLFQPSKLSKYMGMDVTSLMSVPLFIMEPFSMLQKMAEIMEYTNLLDQANAAEDPYERCACHAAETAHVSRCPAFAWLMYLGLACRLPTAAAVLH